MNLVKLQNKLIGAARADAPGDRVPFTFEKRIIALVAARPVTDEVALWVRGLWQAAASCVAVALLFGAWAFLNPASVSNTDDLSQNFVTTLLASVDQNDATP